MVERVYRAEAESRCRASLSFIDLNNAWCMAASPNLALFGLVLSFNLLGDGLCHAPDLRQR